MRQRNEALRPTGNELRGAIERLETSNKELATANQQLQEQIAALKANNAGLCKLLADNETASLCLDRRHRIQWFSPGMKTLIHFIDDDIGRSITDFSSTVLGDNLIEDAGSVLETPAPKQREMMSLDDRWYLRRIQPFPGDNAYAGGVVVTYVDVTDVKHAALRTMAATLEERVRERTARLRTRMAELALSGERERRGLARDLHDDLGQLLAIVKIKLTSLEESERRGALKAPLKEIETLIDQANRWARAMMQQLSPATLQTLGLVPALEWLGEEMEHRHGLAVCIDEHSKVPALEEPVRTTIFAAIRELLINVVKHAKTNVAQINCQRTDSGRTSISVTDHGRGFDYRQALSSPVGDAGFGLIGAKDRIEFIGGEMHVDSMPGYGSTITIVFPATLGH